MKNKTLIISMIILLTILAIGLSVFLYFVISGKTNFRLARNWGTKSEQVIFDESYELEAVNQIEILSSAGNIDFRESDNGKIRAVVYGQDDGKLKTDFNDGTLKIDYSAYKNVSFGFHFYVNDVVVYLPKDYDKKIKVDLNYGDMTAIDLEKATIEFEQDCGDVTLGKIKNVSIRNDYGDVKVNSVLNKLDIKSDCGDIKVDALDLKEDSVIQCDLGDVKIGETNEIYVDTTIDLGDVKVNRNDRQSEVTLKIEVDCGDIKVEN